MILDGCISYLECTVIDKMEAGDHWIVYARVSVQGLGARGGTRRDMVLRMYVHMRGMHQPFPSPMTAHTCVPVCRGRRWSPERW